MRLAETVCLDDTVAVTKLPVDSFESVLVSPATDSIDIMKFLTVEQCSVCSRRKAKSLK